MGLDGGGTPCVDDSDCLPGQACDAGFCRPNRPLPDGAVGDASPPGPRILVEPGLLELGSWFCQDRARELTITNVGTLDLEIIDMWIDEPGTLPEYSFAIEGVERPPFSLAPGQTITVLVTLEYLDHEPDLGELHITSNDPGTPELLILLMGDPTKCNPGMEVCALPGTQADPEPFVDCSVDMVSGDPVIDFGFAPAASDASRLVAIRGESWGLGILGIHVTNSTGLGSRFWLELSLFEWDPLAESLTELPMSGFPVCFRAHEPMSGTPEDWLFVRVHYPTEEEPCGAYIPNELLVIDSNALGSPAIPIMSFVHDCGPDQWDLNCDPSDGCEYLCAYTGPEVCGDGMDNDCNGEVDEGC